MKKINILILLLLCINQAIVAQEKITALRIRPYTDSVKIVDMLSYFVNVEAIYSNKDIYPVIEDDVILTTTHGTVKGLSVFFDNKPHPDSFVVNVALKNNKAITASKVLYIQKINLDAQLMQAPITEIVDSNSVKPKPIIKKKKRKYF